MTARRGFALLAIALAVLAIPLNIAQPMIPFMRPLGLDFANLYLFHHCEVRNAPYSRDDGGALCGDVEGRAMKYPPLLYWSFAWTRPLHYGTALALWAAFILAASWFALRRWLPPDSRGDMLTLLFAALLFVQFPMLFSLERGNSDVLPLLLWTAAFVAFVRERDVLAGSFAGLAIAMKVYPIFAVAVAGTMLLRDLRRAMRFAAGCAMTTAIALLLFARDTMQYVHILRSFAAEHPLPSLFSHGTPSFFPLPTALVLIAILLGSWIVLAWRARPEDPGLIFAGGLAVSTFQAATSYDYNFITAYPLLAILFARMRRDDSRAALPALFLLVTITVPRVLFLGMPRLHAAAEIAALTATALAHLKPSPAPSA